MTTTVLLAGATGMLGNRIAAHLLDQHDADVRLLLRTPAPTDRIKLEAVESLTRRGATVTIGDVTDPATLDAATAGVDVVVSALQGGSETILDGQVALARAAAGNGVRRFLPSDFAIDLFTAPAGAPQFDLRRAAAEAIDALPMQVVHVLSGGFMDMMLDPAVPGLIDLSGGTVMLWGTGDEPFDLTTVEDTARFTARVATDSADVSGVRYLSGGGPPSTRSSPRPSGSPAPRSRATCSAAPTTCAASPPEPTTRGRSCRSGTSCRCSPSPPFPTDDNHRYPDASPSGLRDYLTQAHRALTTA